MPTIQLETPITAAPERCFDLSLSVDLHRRSVAHIHEQPIAGVTTGIMKLDDTVTWEAVHFGIIQHLTSKLLLMSDHAILGTKWFERLFRK